MSETAPRQPQQSSTTLFLVALGAAIAAAILNNLYIAKVRQDVRQESIEVFLLESEVRPGERLSSNDYRAVPVPKMFESTINDLGWLKRDALEARVSTRDPVQRVGREGDPISIDLFVGEGTTDISERITPGMRAKALPINSRTGVPNLAPGMFVDIDATFSRPGGGQVVLPVMEAVEVIAVGDNFGNQGEGGSRFRQSYRTITIEVTPEQATELTAIEQMVLGDFEVYPRNASDTRPVKIIGGGINPAIDELIRIQRDRTLQSRTDSEG